MKNRLIIILSAILLCLTSNAQTIDYLGIESRGSFLQQTKDENGYSDLRAEYFNIQMRGTVTKNVTYRIRQRMNIPIDSENPFRATDLLSITWNPTPKWSLTAGKTSILIGGYEYDSAPIDVYFYSQFCTNLQQAFAFAINSDYEFMPGQSLVLQVCNSPLSSGFQDAYSYNAAWSGNIGGWLHTIWSCNMVEDMDHNFINYLALGNHMTFGGLAFDIDLFHRASPRQEKFFFSDYSIISKLIWTTGNWNWCAKAGYEQNDAFNVDASGKSFDTVIPAGTRYFYGGAGIEYFPKGNQNIRFHLAYFRNNYDHTNNVSLGIKWAVDIIKK